MGLLGGISAGLGEYAGQKAKSMLDAEMSRYKGLASVYESIANNPDVEVPVKQEALRRMSVLSNVNPYDKASKKAAKGLENTQDIWDAHQNIKSGGQFMGLGKPSLSFSATKTATQGLPSAQGVQQSIAAPPQAAGPVQQATQQAPSGPPQPFEQAMAQGHSGEPQAQGPPQVSGNEQLVQGQQDQEQAKQNLMQRVMEIVGPAPETNGMATREYKLWFENAKNVASELAEEDSLKRRFASLPSMGAPGTGGGSPISQRLAQLQQLKARKLIGAMPSIKSGSGSWFGPDGQQHLNEQYYDLEGSKYDASGYPLQFDSNKPFVAGFVREIPGEDGMYMFSAQNPAFTPVASGVRQPVKTSETTRTTGLDGTTHSTTRRGFAGAPVGGTPTQGGAVPTQGGPGVTGPPKVPPAAGMPTEDLTKIRDYPQNDEQLHVSMVLRNPGKYAELSGQQAMVYEQALSKYGLTLPTKEGFASPMMAKETNGYAGLQALHDIKAGLRGFDYAGPIFGRLATKVNEHFASTKVVSFLNQVQGKQDPGPTEDAVLSYADKLLKDPNEVAAMSGDVKVPISEAARTSRQIAYLLTRMRALNAAETAGIAGGGGRGITRLFMMMVPYMMNINQGTNFIEGHGKGIADLLGDEIANVHLTRWNRGANPAMVTIPEGRRQLLKEFGQEDKLTGLSGPDGFAKDGPHKGQPLYRHADGKLYLERE